MKTQDAYSALAGRVFDLFDAVTRGRGVLTAPTVDPLPPPPPPPDPPPPPPPPPGPYIVPDRMELDPEALLMVDADGNFGQAYDREEHPDVTTGAPLKVRLLAGRMLNPIGPRPFASDSYRILVDGVEVQTINPPDGATKFDLVINVDGLAHGWHTLDAVGLANETMVVHDFYVDRGLPNPALMPDTSPTYDLHHRGWKSYTRAMVPTDREPLECPMPQRAPAPFENATVPTKSGWRWVGRQDLVETAIVMPDRIDPAIKRRTKGVIHTKSNQSYYWYTATGAKFPGVAQVMGYRGRSLLSMATHIHVGRTHLYVLTPWNLVKVHRDTGFVSPLLGYFHRGIPERNWPESAEAQKAACDLLGIWECDPGFHEPWGMAWIERTLATDPTRTIPNDGLSGKPENPHMPGAGPAALIPDAQHDRLLRVDWPADTHQGQGVVREVGKFKEPWDAVPIPGTGLYAVSERKAHRIILVDEWGKYVKTLVESPNGDDFCYLDNARVPKRRKALDLCRQELCLLPEGLAYYDGGISWGSTIHAQVRHVDLATLGITVPVPEGPNTAGINFYKIARQKKAAFGPKGASAVSTWSISPRGRPSLYLPDGKAWPYNSLNGTIYGPGLPMAGVDYSSACAFDEERGLLIHSASSYGLWQVGLANAGDKVITEAQWEAWEGAWHDAGFHRIYGDAANSPHGVPRPWGYSENTDNFMRAHGHAQGA